MMHSAAIPLPTAGTKVKIRYRRLGRPTETYRQEVLESGPQGIVTFQSRAPIDAPLAVADTTILEPGSPVIWFTFPRAWHDIGLFHLADGTCTGLYANILTPVEFTSRHCWETTDLSLDIWVPRQGAAHLLDEAELEDAEASGLVMSERAERARREADSLMDGLAAGNWPPPLVREWSLARVREIGAGDPTGHLPRGSASTPESSPGRRR